MLEWLLIGLARVLLPLIELLPLTSVARLGRILGTLAWQLDRRHRKVALANLERCFARDLTDSQRLAIGKENFRRLGENYASAVRTATMHWDELRAHVDLSGVGPARAILNAHPDRSAIIATGHFGNFELLTWLRVALPDVQLATTYRALRQPVATRMLLELRKRSGCLFFERRTEAAALRNALRTRRLVLGFLADQHDGRGIPAPFLGHDAATSVAPAVFALRYDAPLLTAFCFRTGLARWRLEAGDEIATRNPDGTRRAVAAIVADMNLSFERAVRRDPANWFWVHRRWKLPSPSKPVVTSVGATA